MSTLESTPQVLDVAGYAAAVRRSLVDLSREQVDDLTDGLEADLADALADIEHARHGGDLLAQFGPPDAYAAELRAAAGLEVGAAARPSGAGSSLVILARHLTRVARRGARWLRGRAWWPTVVAGATTVRPLWWVVRGWVAYQVAASWWGPSGWSSAWIPSSTGGRLVLGVAILASLVLGTSTAWRSGGRRALVVTLDVLAALALLVTVPVVDANVAQVQADATANVNQRPQPPVVSTRPQNGVVVDGMAVSNLFVYDQEGNPLRDVQIYDDRGRPVRTTFDDGTQEYSFPNGSEPWVFQGRTSVDGRSMWNVYPLLGAPSSTWDWTDGVPTLPEGAQVAQPPAPFAKAPAVQPTP